MTKFKNFTVDVFLNQSLFQRETIKNALFKILNETFSKIDLHFLNHKPAVVLGVKYSPVIEFNGSKFSVKFC